MGRTVYRYADEIFGIGRELMEALEGRPPGRAMQLTVGIANAVPKLVVYRLLRPALSQPDPVRLVCWEDDPEQLIAQLGTYLLDVVIANAPAPVYLPIKVFNHLLGESDIALFAPTALAKRLSRHFPESLRKAPLLMPTTNSPLRHALEDWFDLHEITPHIVGEFEDSALMKVFGRAAGVGQQPASGSSTPIAVGSLTMFVLATVSASTTLRQNCFLASGVSPSDSKTTMRRRRWPRRAIFRRSAPWNQRRRAVREQSDRKRLFTIPRVGWGSAEGVWRGVSPGTIGTRTRPNR